MMTMMMTRSFYLSVLVSLLVCSCAVAKECTNIPTQSHTVQAQLLATKNMTWKNQVLASLNKVAPPTDDSVWSELLPNSFPSSSKGGRNDLGAMYSKVKNRSGFNNSQGTGGFLKEVPLQDVRVLPLNSLHGRAQQTNMEYLLMLDADRLLWSFRKNAGLATPGTPYGGWEAPDIELRGHFVGHYLSASALMWASTQNDTLKQKMTAVVAGLSACQQKIGTGYLSAFPPEFFDRYEAVRPVWAPYYTIHKILAGLLDQHTFAGNPDALKIATGMADYFYNRVMNVITQFTINRHYQAMNDETGGMNDVLYRLYTLTGDQKHLLLGQLFDKPCFLGILAVQASDIADLHANTHIPILIGAQKRYEVTGDPLYKDMGVFFMDLINSSHSYATGGTSVNEWWHDPERMADTLKTPENEESCSTYNMLKVSRYLFRWTKQVSYADYYERALTNGVLSIQRGTTPGVMIYMLPLGSGVSKAVSFHGWGTPFDTFWCCYGTGIESFSKLGDSIYFEEEGKGPTVYIIQYISSSFNWKTGNVMITQTADPVVSWDPFLRVTFTFAPNGAASQSTLKFRLPSWTSNGAKATLNDKPLTLPAPGNFLAVTRQWSAADKLKLEFPITLRTETIKDDRPEFASLKAILYGPYLLAGHTTGDSALKAGANTTLSDVITPIRSPGLIVSFSQDFANSTYALTNANQSLITMQQLNATDSDPAAPASFRLVPKDPSVNLATIQDAIDKIVILEPFLFPGMSLVPNQEQNNTIVVGPVGPSSFFHVMNGLDGRNGTLSLHSEANNACFVTTGLSPGGEVKLGCGGSGDAFNQAASFKPVTGLVQFNPISFVAKGVNRDFLLEPLLSFKDLHYTVYFNFTS